MFDLFKSSEENRPQDVKGLRDALLRFIKDELQKVEGGEGRHIKGLYLFIACAQDEKHIYESAVYVEETDLLKNEIQKIADDFAIDLPDTWTLETTFVEELPPEAKKITDLDAALFIKTLKQTIEKSATAYIRILNGQAEKEEYVITSSTGRINLGRDKKVQDDDGFFRINMIAFPQDDNESNKYISRQHAHIDWNNDGGFFMLYADEGGIPPRNKIKVRSVIDENPVKLNSTQIGHVLREADQIILGESAVLEFSYLPTEV